MQKSKIFTHFIGISTLFSYPSDCKWAPDAFPFGLNRNAFSIWLNSN